MNQQITREDARSLLARAGLSASDERLDGLVAGFQIARAAAAALASLELGYRGPSPFQPPPPADGR
ncbi:MAG TPA: hypothetical protein VIW01_12880 [Dehalococcoidia bacterium]